MINKFQGSYRFLSNFWMCPVEFEGIIYPSSEHAYVAAKTLDQEKRKEIAKVSKPGDVKRVGRKLNLRSDWEEVKYDVMLEIVRDKFNRNPNLAKSLLITGNQELVEDNTWGDTIWGVCNGIGQNCLGKILMQVRDELRLSS